jgi:PTH1 family peptidyl-tRNA hydrolase
VPDEADNNPPWLIIGLGNPGSEYQRTYHNVGFRVIAILAGRYGVSLTVRMGEAGVARLRDPLMAVLVQPKTYMNRSGIALVTLLERFGHDSRLLVVSDDLALPLGKIRIRERGSAGGHNGLKSIYSAYGSDEYVRVRVGIMPTRGVQDGKEFVLSNIAQADREALGRAEALAADAVEHILRAGARSAMSEYNGTDLRELET